MLILRVNVGLKLKFKTKKLAKDKVAHCMYLLQN